MKESPQDHPYLMKKKAQKTEKIPDPDSPTIIGVSGVSKGLF